MESGLVDGTNDRVDATLNRVDDETLNTHPVEICNKVELRWITRRLQKGLSPPAPLDFLSRD